MMINARSPLVRSASMPRRPRMLSTPSVESLEQRSLLSAVYAGAIVHGSPPAEVQVASEHHRGHHGGEAHATKTHHEHHGGEAHAPKTHHEHHGGEAQAPETHHGHDGSAALTGGGKANGHGISAQAGGPIPVQVINSGAANPLPVVDSRTPFEVSFSLDSSTSAGVEAFYRVPAGERLEIDHVNALLFAAGSNNAIDDIFIGNGDNIFTRYLPQRSPNYSYEYIANTDALTFATANQTIVVGFDRTNGAQEGYGNITISGFLTPIV